MDTKQEIICILLHLRFKALVDFWNGCAFAYVWFFVSLKQESVGCVYVNEFDLLCFSAVWTFA
jgi:hypothetical protein